MTPITFQTYPRTNSVNSSESKESQLHRLFGLTFDNLKKSKTQYLDASTTYEVVGKNRLLSWKPEFGKNDLNLTNGHWEWR